MTTWVQKYKFSFFLTLYVDFLQIYTIVLECISAQKYCKTCLTSLLPQIFNIMQRARCRAHLSSTSWVDFLRKNDRKMVDTKSIQDHFRDVPGASGDQKTWKTIDLSDLGASGKISKIWWKPIILKGFGTYISQIFHAGACVACGGPLGRYLNDS